MAQVRITDSAGTERGTIPLVHLAKEQLGLNAEALARVTVNRDDLNSITGLTPGEDRVYIEDPIQGDTFGGILRTPGRSGGRPIMLVDSFSEYMARAQPVALGQQKTAIDDSTLIQECIDATPQLSAGTIETIAAGKTWIFSGISQRAKARKVAEAAGGELVFNADRTVDYVSSRGRDRTGTTLSPANGSFVEDTFNVDRDGVSGNTTHLKVYGVGQGTSQIEATVVPADDSGSYTNSVTYTNPTWSDGDDEIWGRRTNKDLKNVSALQSWGQKLIEDLQDEEIRVETVVKGEPVALGDRFRVSHPEEDVDDDLRAVEVTTLRSGAGTRYEVVFSNYDVGHLDLTAEDHKDVGRYNQAFEGDLTNVQQSPGRGPVGPNHDYFIYVYYPDDVVAEVNAQLLVKGTNYRAYVAGAAGGGDHTHSVDVTHPSHSHDVTHPSHSHNVTHPSHTHNVTHPSHNHDVSFGTKTSDAQTDPDVIEQAGRSSNDVSLSDTSWTTVTSLLPASTSSGERMVILLDAVQINGNGVRSVLLRIFDNTTNTYYPSSGNFPEVIIDSTVNDYAGTHIAVPADVSGHDVEIEARLLTSSDTVRIGWVWWIEGDHTHDVTVGTDTSTTALGTTETSTAALGTTETSTTALGTTETSTTALGTTNTETSDASGTHTHAPDPGILDWDGAEKTPQHYPENVDVLVNGTSQGTALGDGTGEFEERVDLGTELTAGWNTIRLTSAGLGHLDASFSADLFRQSL